MSNLNAGVMQPGIMRSGIMRPGIMKGAGSGVVVPAWVVGFTAANTQSLKRAMNAVINGTGNGRIACAGDSTTAGQGSDGTTNPGLRSLSYPSKLAAALALRYGITAQADNWYGSTSLTSTTYPQYDPRFAMGGGAWSSTAQSLGGFMYVAANNTATPTFTPAHQFDRVDYVFADRGGGINLIADAQSAVTVATQAANALLTGTATMAALASVLKYQGATANGIQLAGTQTWNSAIKQMMIANMGWRGSVVGNWTPNPTTNTWDCFKALAAIDFDVVIINLGINDMVSTPLANFNIAYPRFIGQLKDAGTDVICVVPSIQGSSDVDGFVGAPTQATILSFNDAIRTHAVNTGVALIDTPKMPNMSSWAQANTAGLMYDKQHPNGAGYAAIASGTDQALAFGLAA